VTQFMKNDDDAKHESRSEDVSDNSHNGLFILTGMNSRPAPKSSSG